jgi:hypothetical protein
MALASGIVGRVEGAGHRVALQHAAVQVAHGVWCDRGNRPLAHAVCLAAPDGHSAEPLVDSPGSRAHELNRVPELVIEHRDAFWRTWNEYHRR